MMAFYEKVFVETLAHERAPEIIDQNFVAILKKLMKVEEQLCPWNYFSIPYA